VEVAVPSPGLSEASLDLSCESERLMTASECDRLCVVLVATRNPLNIGAAARAMSNFGFQRLRVVNPYQVAFREARSAVGASALLAAAEEYETIAEAVADCALVVGTTALHHRGLQHSFRRLENGAPLIRRQLSRSRVALLFGSEKRGLSNQDLSHCHWLMRIPTREQHPSMNLGQAVAVCLYELVRGGKTTARGETREVATAGELERITALLLEALRESGYLKPRAGKDSAAGAPSEPACRRCRCLARCAAANLMEIAGGQAAAGLSIQHGRCPTTRWTDHTDWLVADVSELAGRRCPKGRNRTPWGCSVREQTTCLDCCPRVPTSSYPCDRDPARPPV
jgi:tRNA/rRNA methyltransferase